MKFLKYLFSMSFAGALLLAFGVIICVATFIENDFGPIGSQSIVYKARWFELLLAIMAVNMIGVIVVQKMWRREKWTNLLFHSAFITILIGAGITRFFSEEGLIHIREGEASNSFVSDATYMRVEVLDGGKKQEFNNKVLFSRIKNNKFGKEIKVNEGTLKLKLKHFIFNAKQIAEPDPGYGQPIVTVAVAGENGREYSFIKNGEYIHINGLLLGLNTAHDHLNSIRFIETDSGLVIQAEMPVNTLNMDTQEAGKIEAHTTVIAPYRTLFTANGVNFVLSDYHPESTIKIISAPAENNEQTLDAIVLEATLGSQKQDVVLFGGQGFIGQPVFLQLGDVNMNLSYGAKRIEIPFSIELKDFQLERYPGSMSPSSYASEVIVHDGNTSFPFRIYMNHVLDYGGYRFYQSSYDQDELGTVLSVNRDRPGTMITYVGYILLAFGLISIAFSKNTRFRQLSIMIDAVHEKRQKLAGVFALLFMLSASLVQAQEYPEVPSRQRAEAFGRLIYQSNEGRMAPINSLANDLLRKIYKTSSLGGYSADQVILGMMSQPREWQKVKIIKVNHADIRKELLIDSKYANYNHFFDETGNYILLEKVNAAYAKKPSIQNTLDKELIKVDERLNICYMIYQASLLKIFPVPIDPDHLWVAPFDREFYGLSGTDSIFVRNALVEYFKSLSSGDLTLADDILNAIKNYQSTYGAAVLPSPIKVNLEIKFNEWNIFEKLFPYHMLVGFVLLIVLFARVLSPNLLLKWPFKVLVALIFAGFLVHTVGLGLRCYISGHAPWSNGYEAMIYIGWASLLAGLAFGKRSPMTLAVTAILSGIILFVAHLSFLDPQITNLVPVLKSYWLTIHVATITASYVFFALGALLAFVNLVTMIFKTPENNLRLSLSIKELTYVIEMTLTIGLMLLTIGNFLGGVWANESWGRYWVWDPKETWALASIVFYAFVIHMRFIPGMQSLFTFNFASLITFASIIMTFFGVNYYLSGLHSYAAGDPLPIPTFVYYTIAVVAIISLMAYWNNNRLIYSYESEE